MTPLSSFQDLDDPFDSTKFAEPSKFSIVPTETLRPGGLIMEDDGVEIGEIAGMNLSASLVGQDQLRVQKSSEVPMKEG